MTNGVKAWVVCEHNGAMIDNILHVYLDENDAIELVADNKERFPHTNFSYEQVPILFPTNAVYMYNFKKEDGARGIGYKMNKNSSNPWELTTKKPIVAATCGKFEIIHADHINLFKKMSEMADDVHVYLNSNESILAYTGLKAVVSQELRAEVLRAIKYIDKVFILRDPRPGDMIKVFQPDIWVKGGDYDIEKMKSTPIVRSYGGEVICIPHKYGIHSSEIAEQYRKGMENK